MEATCICISTPAAANYGGLIFPLSGKRTTLSIGKYPAIFLSEARQAAENARRMIAQGQDPAAAKQQAKQERKAALLNTFTHIAKAWHEQNTARKS